MWHAQSHLRINTYLKLKMWWETWIAEVWQVRVWMGDTNTSNKNNMEEYGKELMGGGEEERKFMLEWMRESEQRRWSPPVEWCAVLARCPPTSEGVPALLASHHVHPACPAIRDSFSTSWTRHHPLKVLAVRPACTSQWTLSAYIRSVHTLAHTYKHTCTHIHLHKHRTNRLQCIQIQYCCESKYCC